MRRMARRWSSSSSRLCSGGVVGREARRRPDFNAVQGGERSSRWRPHGGALTVEDGRTMLLSDAARRSSAGLRSYAGGAERSDGRRGRKKTAGATSDPDTRARAGSDTGRRRGARAGVGRCGSCGLSWAGPGKKERGLAG